MSTGLVRAVTSRRPWSSAPAEVRAAAERLIGAPVAVARTQRGGFSCGIACRVRTSDGGRAFVKAVSLIDNAVTAAMFMREAAVAAALPAEVPAPALLGHTQVDGWVLLVFEDVAGRVMSGAWSRHDAMAVMGSIMDLTEIGTPCPVAVVEPWGGPVAHWPGWADLVATGRAEQVLEDWARRHLRELVDLERQYPAATAGDTLLHGDLRADNVILSGRSATFVDWAWAARGAPWLDPLIFSLCAVLQGIADPERVFLAHPSARAADPHAVDCVLAALAGRFVNTSSLPPAGNPGLRAFQRAEAAAALGWLARRTGWR